LKVESESDEETNTAFDGLSGQISPRPHLAPVEQHFTAIRSATTANNKFQQLLRDTNGNNEDGDSSLPRAP